MADTKISAATAASAAQLTDELPVNEAGAAKKVTLTQVRDLLTVAKPYATGSFTVATGNYVQMVMRLILTGSQRATLAGTARLRIN